MIITEEMKKVRQGLHLINGLEGIIESMALENKEAKEALLEKVEAIKQDLLDAQTSLEDITL